MVLSFSVCICLYHVFVMQMDFYGFANGACHHTLNLASTAWVLYSLAEDLVSLGALCLGPATNNIAEYEAVIGLLPEAAVISLQRYFTYSIVYRKAPCVWLCIRQHYYRFELPIHLRKSLGSIHQKQH